MLEWYQHIPEHINPIVFSIGSFSVRWYSIMYLASFLTVYLLLKCRIKESSNKISVSDLMIYLIAGLLIGARLGYVVFYGLSYFINHPLKIFLPFDVNCQLLNVNCLDYTGIYGMSYFGGLLGVIIAGLIFCRRNFRGSTSLSQNDQKRSNLLGNFWQLADFIIPAVPAGYFFGRIGNFLNGELYGKITTGWWGMYFPADESGLLRHPSQLYEAFLEGLVLFAILWLLRNKSIVKGQMLSVYLFGYGFFRFFCEFFREPVGKSPLILNYFTLEQALSAFIMTIAVGVCITRCFKSKKMA